MDKSTTENSGENVFQKALNPTSYHKFMSFFSKEKSESADSGEASDHLQVQTFLLSFLSQPDSSWLCSRSQDGR